MARVLVLGGTSYVAQFVLRSLQSERHLVANGGEAEEVEAVACTLRGKPFSPLPEGVEAEAGAAVRVYWRVEVQDVAALETCVQDFRPTVVINCAAISSPAVCQKDPEKAQAVNEPRGLVTLLERLPWRVRLVHLSTDFVYEGTQPRGASYGEDDAVLSSTLSVYGASKLRFDHFLLERGSTNVQTLILRIANVVGPPAPLFPGRSASKFMQWLHHQLFQPETPEAPLKLWSDEFRSYLYIVDLVKIMFQLLAVDAKAPATLVNVGGVEALSRVELAQKYLAACERTHPKAAAAISRAITPTLRARVDLGYPAPLNTQLSTARLAGLLPNLTWTPTAQVLDEVSHSFLV